MDINWDNNSDNPSYQSEKLKAIIPPVKICRDFFSGFDRVILKEYLPKLSYESDLNHTNRLAITAFSNMYSPIITSLCGIVTKREPLIDGFEDFPLEDIDSFGNSFHSFVKHVCTSSLVAGTEFISVETNPSKNTVFLKRYNYEQLMSYAFEGDNLVQIVFKEEVEQRSGNFKNKSVERYIVYKPYGGELWYDKGKGLRIQEEWKNELSEIPVVSIDRGKRVSRFEFTPRFYDIVMLNKVMLNFQSQKANVLSLSANPIPVFWGEQLDEKVDIGVRNALTFRDKGKGGFEFVEIKGNGVEFLSKEIDRLRDDIDRLSFSMLHRDGSKTVIDAQDNQSKSTSTFGEIAEELEVKFNKLFTFIAFFMGKKLAKTAKLDFKKDFDDMLFSDDQLKMLQAMVKDGYLSPQTYWRKVQGLGGLPKDMDFDLEVNAIESWKAMNNS